MIQRATALAPAKLNLGLEVLGRRDDGYHEIVSILQTITLFDTFIWSSHGEPFSYESPPSIDPKGDLVAQALDTASDSAIWAGTLTLRKSIPTAAGLGGGSSDAALALRITHPDMDVSELEERAASLGSDVPFFLRGSAALATGVGTTLRQIPPRKCWFVIVTPHLVIPSKTQALYASLDTNDLSDGSEVFRRADTHDDSDWMASSPPNAFTRQLSEYAEVRAAWLALERAGAPWVSVSGAGPSLYTAVRDFGRAREIAMRIPPSAGTVNVARSLAGQHTDAAAKNLAWRIRGAARAR